MGYFVGVTLLYTPVGYLSSDFCDAMGTLTFLAPHFYLNNKKSYPHLYGDNFKNDGKINFN